MVIKNTKLFSSSYLESTNSPWTKLPAWSWTQGPTTLVVSPTCIFPSFLPSFVCVCAPLSPLCCMARGLSVSWPGIKPAPPALQSLSLNHWTTREVLLPFLPFPLPLSLFLFPSYGDKSTYHGIYLPNKILKVQYSIDVVQQTPRNESNFLTKTLYSSKDHSLFPSAATHIHIICITWESWISWCLGSTPRGSDPAGLGTAAWWF